MIYGSVCSGIEAASVAWHPLGWKPAFFAEIEKFPSAVLAHRWPEVPNLGDFTKIGRQNESIDLLVGGTPCQSFSVAGLRAGLDDPRGNLALEFLGLADRLRPRWVVFENVPGLLSSGRGRDFGSFLGALGQLGYGWAYRVLDAQHFGVPQRRRRVFVVGHLGDWRLAAAVLFERQSLSGDTLPRREARQGITGGVEVGPSGGRYTDTSSTLDARAKDSIIRNQIGVAAITCPTLRSGGNQTGGDRPPGTDVDTVESLVVTGGSFDPPIGLDEEQNAVIDGFGTLKSREKGGGFEGSVLAPVTPSLVSNGDAHSGFRDEHGIIAIRTAQTSSNGWGVNTDGQAYTLDETQGQAVAFEPHHDEHEGRGANFKPTDSHPALRGPHGCDNPLIKHSMAVRRLTPRECERLQGFPDDYTLIPFNGKMACDGPRYKSLGNSMAVPVMRWIGERIQMVDDLKGVTR